MEEVVKFKAIIEDREQEMNVRIEGGRVHAEVGGRVYDLELREPEPGCYLFLRDAQVHECRVSESHDGIDVSLHERKYTVTIVDPKRLRSGA